MAALFIHPLKIPPGKRMAMATRKNSSSPNCSSPDCFSLTPGASALGQLPARHGADAPSLLQRLLLLTLTDRRWRISFDDLTGLIDRVPDLRLPLDHLQHSCPFCTRVKGDAAGFVACARNKHAVNRLLLYRGQPMAGPCHLGLTDIVEPLLAGGRVLGAFYCGSVLVRGSEAGARRKIERYCARRRLAARPLLDALRAVPLVSRHELDAMRGRLRLLAETVVQILEAQGCPVGTEKASVQSRVWREPHPLPLPLRRALDKMRMRYHEPLELRALAADLQVSADYLGRLFRRHLGRTYHGHLAQLRVDHARRLLAAGFPAGDVAYRVGFADQAHLCRVFKRLTGVTPHAFSRS